VERDMDYSKDESIKDLVFLPHLHPEFTSSSEDLKF
jgi:hypothetical protein